jgi:hypothetical protein
MSFARTRPALHPVPMPSRVNQMKHDSRESGGDDAVMGPYFFIFVLALIAFMVFV